MSEISEDPVPAEGGLPAQPATLPAVEEAFDEIDVDEPLVGIIMGSKNDKPKMQPAGAALHEHGISYEVRVLSAHRQPDETAEYCTNAKMRGMKVIIAGAGMSAALPGVAAAHTELPVIGVPILGKSLGGDHPLLGPGVGRGQLHGEPRLHPAALRPDGADLLARVAGDHALIMRTASSPAFLAPSIATQPTGTPGGIWTADSSASRPPRFLPPIGTPITGRSLLEAAKPGSAADIPAPAMITFSPRMRALAQYSPVSSGWRWALRTRTS